MKRVLPLLALLPLLWLFWRGEPLKHSGTLDGDPFSIFLVALVLASLSATKATSKLYLAAALLVVAVSTRNLLVFVLAFSGLGLAVTRFAAFGAFVALSSLPMLGGTDLAVLAESAPPGLVVLGVGVAATWLAVHRTALWQSEQELSEGVFFSFGSLVAMTSLLVRVAAWNPDLPSVEVFHSSFAFSSLAAGTWGVWRSKTTRDFVGWLTISQVGYLSLFVLGGPFGREAVLLQLGTSCFALFAAALARDRFLLVLGALAAFSPPPFPGFAVKFVAASSVLAEGHLAISVTSLLATVLLGLGCVRFLRRVEMAPVSRYSLPVGLVAFVFLGIAPELSFRVASRAAAGLF